MNGPTPRSHAYHFGPTRYADHFLYRCYDADGILLYIGCTNNVKRRLAAHRTGSAKASRWLAARIASHEVEGPLPGRDAARDAERNAIRNEQPVLNFQERGTENLAPWMTTWGVAAYLVKHGHRQLAIETACTCRPEEFDGVIYTFRCEAHESAGAELAAGEERAS